MPSRPSRNGDPALVTGLRLPRCCRLVTARDFRLVYGRGDRARGRLMTVVGLHRRSPGFRVGLSVSKDNGPAVRRNKIKRLLREAFRHERHRLRGQFDVVLIPRPEVERFVLDELRAELVALVGKLRERPPRSERRR